MTQDLATEWALLLEWLHERAFRTAWRTDTDGDWPMEIVQAERLAGGPWPHELRSWFWLHAGEQDVERSRRLIPRFELLGLSDAVVRRSFALSTSGPMTGPGGVAGEDTSTFCAELVPVAGDGDHRHLVVDLRPGPAQGSVVVLVDGVGTSYATGPSWPSLAALVADLRRALRDGLPFLDATPEVVASEVVWQLGDEEQRPTGLTPVSDAPERAFIVEMGRAAFVGRHEPPGPEEYDEAAQMLDWDAGPDAAGEWDPTLNTDYDGPDVVTVWRAFRSWLEEHAPASAADVSTTGATPAQVAAAEAETGLEWTDELRTWFTLHGGSAIGATRWILDGCDILDLETALTHRTMSLEVQASADEDAAEYGFPDEPEDPDHVDEAGTMSAGFVREFVVIGNSHARSELVVDLRPGPLRGCVLDHEWEDGGATRPDLGWPCIAAKLWDLLGAVQDGRPARDGAFPVVTPDGFLDWTYP
jgi:cell wall assembly regulator SMI1